MRTHRPRRGALSSARWQRTGGRGLRSPVVTCLWRLLSSSTLRVGTLPSSRLHTVFEHGPRLAPPQPNRTRHIDTPHGSAAPQT